jgi:hypothetical protein
VLLAGIIAAAVTVATSPIYGVPAAVLALFLLVRFGDERRRWREAAAARVELAETSEPAERVRERPRSRPPAPALPTIVVAGDPFRSPPAPPVIVVERPAVPSTPVDLAASSTAPEPTILV